MKNKAECIRRLTVLRDRFHEDSAVLRKFKQGKLTIRLGGGYICDIDDPDDGEFFQHIINDFESCYPGYTVYHCIEAGGPLVYVLYIGPNRKEWDEERVSEDGYLSCFVYNAWDCDFSEPGQVKMIDLW